MHGLHICPVYYFFPGYIPLYSCCMEYFLFFEGGLVYINLYTVPSVPNGLINKEEQRDLISNHTQ